MLKKSKITGMGLVGLLTLFLFVPIALAGVKINTAALRTAVTVAGVREHQAVLQTIADANGGNRASGTAGHDDSAAYVAQRLADAGYSVEVQPFDFAFFQENSLPVMEQVSPNPTSYPAYDVTGFATMEYSGAGDVTAPVQAVDVIIPAAPVANTSTSGCEASDFNSFTAGNIALVQRGTCPFAQKAQNAQNAGAVGVIIFNEGQDGRTDAFNGTLGSPDFSVPIVGAAYAVGVDLYNLSQQGEVTVRLMVDALSETRSTVNVIGTSPNGRTDRAVVVGAHLDSVPEGPGINDNGSGSAVILEIAEQMSALGISPRNQVRFAFWGAEESGLLGAEYYVSQLSSGDIKDIAVNLNFDMVGSPNYVRFVYDGDGSDTPTAGPNGSKNVEAVFLEYFSDPELGGGLPVVATAFDGRSDYGPFIDVGIPAGGLFTGAEGIKTAEEAAIYGGTAGVAYDPCYHEACDTFDNNSNQALDEMSDATAHAVLTFAMTNSAVNGTGKSSKVKAETLPYRGSHFQQ